MGVEEQNIYAETRVQNDLAQRQYDRSIPEWNARLQDAGQTVLNDAEARGVYRSGATIEGAARARAGVARQQQEQLAQVGDQAISYGLDAARRIAAIRRANTEQILNDRTAQTTAGATAAYGG
jgi:hypothetical protein